MIIGVNTSHDTSFSGVSARGELLWLVEEERFNRVKHTHYFSLDSLEEVIARGLLEPAEVTALAYNFESGEEADRLRARAEENVVRTFGPAALEELARYSRGDEPRFGLGLGLGSTQPVDAADGRLRGLFPTAPATFYGHHLTHAASAFFPSPFDEAAVLVVDGSGHLETVTIWRGGPDGLDLRAQVELPHSLGLFYLIAAFVIGLKEGELMGLAPYGVPRYADALRERVIAIGGPELFRLKSPVFFWGGIAPEHGCRHLLRAVPIARRSSRGAALTQEHADFAASVQLVTEEALLELTRQARRLTGSRNLCLAGGVMQNCVALGRLVGSDIFERYWVQPIPHDAGSAWGAALLAARDQGTLGRSPTDTAFLGLPLTEDDIRDTLDRTGSSARRCSDPAGEAAAELAAGRVAGWVRGRAEVGPRALGARSLLAGARFRLNHFRMNAIKSRAPWRPLAPVFPEAQLHRFAAAAAPSPHMNLAFPLQREAADRYPAAVHVDGSARVQTVRPGDAGGLSRVLDVLDALHHGPCVLNTSFNGPGEPIVQTALEALRLFVTTELDVLFLGEWRIDRKPALRREVEQALRANRYLTRYLRVIGDREAVIPEPAGEPAVGELLADSLGWIGVRVLRCREAELAGLAAPERARAVLTPSPASVLRHLPADPPDWVRSATWVFVADDLFPSGHTFEQLRATVERNRAALADRIQGRSCVLWMSAADRAQLLRDFPQLSGADWVDQGATPSAGRGLLIVSSGIPSSQWAVGVRTMDESIVWVARDSDLRHG